MICQRRAMFRFLLASLIWLPGLVSPAAWAEGVLHLVASGEGEVYREAVDAFRAAYAGPRPVRVWQLADLDRRQLRALTGENDLMVPIGLNATREVAENHAGRAAVLALLIPHVTAERLVWPAGLSRRKLSHVHIDQPTSRTLGLVAAAFPQAKRVGLVVSGENADTVRSLQQDAARQRLALNVEMVARPEQVAPALREVLPESDVLLLVPDSIAMHGGNARNVLLTTYRYRVPTVGFSEGLARAGAVASVYSSPAQIGRQGALMAARWKPESGDLPLLQSADEFSVSYNSQVARSLGVSLPDLGEVRRKLGAREE